MKILKNKYKNLWLVRGEVELGKVKGMELCHYEKCGVRNNNECRRMLIEIKGDPKCIYCYHITREIVRYKKH